MILRNNELFYRSQEQQHAFNFPFQIGTDSKDHANHAYRADIEAKPGDLIVLGSDGLFDNIFDEDIMKILNQNQELVKNGQFQKVASLLAQQAQSNSHQPVYMSPFAKNAMKHGLSFLGGEYRDVWCFLNLFSPIQKFSVIFRKTG